MPRYRMKLDRSMSIDLVLGHGAAMRAGHGLFPGDGAEPSRQGCGVPLAPQFLLKRDRFRLFHCREVSTFGTFNSSGNA